MDVTSLFCAGEVRGRALKMPAAHVACVFHLSMADNGIRGAGQPVIAGHVIFSYPAARLIMDPTTLEQIIPELRDAIGPVILISGVGLLLLTMTNRRGRAIDRARQKIQF